MKKLNILTLIIFIASAYAVKAHAISKLNADSSCDCAFYLKQELEKTRINFQKEYESKLADLRLDNESEFYEGTSQDEAVILIHGFTASPFEVRAVGQKLNDLGYNVYMPLLFGFGSTGGTANLATMAHWRAQIKYAVKTLSKCYKKISIGGISLGAALAFDYTMNEYLKQKNHDDFKITSLLLFAPYFDLSISAAKLVIGPLSSFKELISLDTLSFLSHSDDLTYMLKNSRYYNSEMPLVTLNQLLQLSTELQSLPPTKKSSIPVAVYVSQFDTTVELNIAESLPKKHFSNVSVFSIDKNLKVPHQMTLPEANPKFSDMMRHVVHHVNHSNILSLKHTSE